MSNKTNKYNLLTLAKKALSFQPNGISKVKFAKILYLTHKGLVQKNLAKPESIAFIRMPLGPVPVGFKNLTNRCGIRLVTRETGLAYDAQVYYLEEHKRQEPLSLLEGTLRDITMHLVNFPTSELVAYTHDEPSWKKHVNGEEYFISAEDIKRPLPRNKRTLSQEIDEQHLQARLISGMMNDIVNESTLLEYPNLED